MDTQSQSNKHIVRNLAIFTFLVITLGWIGRWLDSLVGSTSSQGIGMLIWIIAPLGVSFLLRAFAGDGWKDLGIRPAIKGNILWYIISILVYPVSVGLIIIVGLAFDVIFLTDFSMNKAVFFVQAFVVLIGTMFFKNVFEEFTWRGYLAPKMYKLRLNVFVAHIVVGLIWGAWHLPYLRAITPHTTESLATLIPRFLAGAIAVSIVYGEIRILTNSVWPAVLMHTVGGAFVGVLLLKELIKMKDGMEFLFSPAIEGVLSIVLFTLIGIGLYLLRRKRMAATQK
ncbi:MAG: CPBP family intramembrane glutamic endopeptidase [Thermodesulfobacteriota bacterium]